MAGQYRLAGIGETIDFRASWKLGRRSVRLHQGSALEAGPGADEWDEVGAIDGSPTDLSRLDELEHHRQAKGMPSAFLPEPIHRS
ncbi:hypothetical protein [Kitasatospora sp. SolWspMP-SS2h]|uniref:hypothetical protein n=1 Tax=Kitasatospora sp. SolWspMP-SS2h TaxID=1305729 RepID=UPI001314B80B|nr:hypothetical protein [Kitasatospora sp. SolWspMP-SS2h]